MWCSVKQPCNRNWIPKEPKYSATVLKAGLVFNGGGKKIGVTGLGDNKIGAPEVVKEFHEVEDKNKGVFDIGEVVRSNSDSHSCSISLEQVKEIGELIRVSWVKADAKRMMDNESHKAFAERNGDAVTEQQSRRMLIYFGLKLLMNNVSFEKMNKAKDAAAADGGAAEEDRGLK
ncbi:hypothetical protein Tco_0462460 [Tanacetum coccineum]